MRLAKTIYSLSLLLSVAWSGPAHAQYLNRESYPLWRNQAYENYAFYSYRDIRLLRQRGTLLLDEETRVYDPFGITLLNGRDLYRMQEFRSLSPLGGSTIFKDDLYRDLFQNLVVASDSYKGWGSSVILGRAVDAHFTPTILSVPRLDGIRWDGDSRRNRFSIVGSRISDPLRVLVLSRPLDFVTYLFGGHWQTQIGSALKFSASYVNTHITDTLVDRGKGSFRKGVFPINLETPETIFLAVSDDSPEDGRGARVHAVEMYVDGQRSAAEVEGRKVRDLISLGRQRRNLSERLRVEEIAHLRQRQSWLPRAISFESLFDERRGMFQDGEVVDFQAGPLRADGDDVLLFRFEVPPEAEDISFRMLVSDDYAIDMGAAIGRAGVLGSTWDDWRGVTRARGNIRDESNLGWVEFDYGFPTGLELYGARAELDLFGFGVQGDYSVSTHHLVFPSELGRRHNNAEHAYSMVGTRRFSRAELGWEFFRLPPGYRTSFTYWDDFVPGFKEYQLVEDNDDFDQWPDSWEHDDPLNLRFQEDITKAAQQVHENLFPPSLRNVGFGVFPGLDENGDGVFDTNVNDNSQPDFREPFLMYYVESEDFVYGDDFNNNGVVDSRENDNKPDYAYERDSEGRHLFIAFQPLPELKLSLGGHDAEQIAGWGRNRALYAKVEYRRPLGSHLRLDLRHRTKRVQDDIPDPLYQYISNPLLQGNYEIVLRNDPLDFRNSLATLSYLRFDYTGIDKLNLNATVRYELNHRLDSTFDGGHSQQEGDDWSIALVNRADYSWEPVEKLVITPMLKWTYRRSDSSVFEGTLANETTLAPIVRADYFLTERTTLRAGLQGFPLLKHRFRSEVTPQRDFDARHYILILQNTSSYIGYQVSLNMGFRKSFTDFVSTETLGKLETSEFFLQVRTN